MFTTPNKPLQVGITGGIGAGKSVVAKFFSVLGVPVYNADERGKWILANDSVVINYIKQEFGEAALKEGKPDTRFLGTQVFNNAEKLQKLNSVIHPRVAEDYEQWLKKRSTVPYTIKEAAIMYESGSHKTVDKMIVVYAPLALRMKRVLKRDGHRTETDVQNIIEKQLPDEEKIKRADYVIYNDEQMLIIPQLLELHKVFLNTSKQ